MSYNFVFCFAGAAFCLGTVVQPLANAQSYSPIFAPLSSNQQTIVCYDQNHRPINGASITITNGVYFQSNAHYHSSPLPPVSSLSPTSGTTGANGAFTYTVSTTLIGQAEYVDFSCYSSGVTLTTRFDNAVGYGDLYYNDHPDIWIKTGGSDTGGGTGHGTTAYNRYMTSPAANGLYAASVEYLNAHAADGITQLCTNDMSLYVGGKFDIYDNWTNPHASHDRGTAGDVASAGGGAQCPATSALPTANMEEFKQDCVDNDAKAANTIVHYNLHHVHCAFSDPATFPH